MGVRSYGFQKKKSHGLVKVKLSEFYFQSGKTTDWTQSSQSKPSLKWYQFRSLAASCSLRSLNSIRGCWCFPLILKEIYWKVKAGKKESLWKKDWRSRLDEMKGLSALLSCWLCKLVLPHKVNRIRPFCLQSCKRPRPAGRDFLWPVLASIYNIMVWDSLFPLQT